MKIVINRTHLRTMSEESSSTPRGLPTRPLHETLQPAVPLPPLLAKQNSNSDSNTSLDASTTTSDTTESGTSNQDPRPGFNGTWRTNSDVAERKVVMKQMYVFCFVKLKRVWIFFKYVSIISHDSCSFIFGTVFEASRDADQLLLNPWRNNFQWW